LIRNIGLPFKLVKSFFQVRRIFQSFKPTAVIGVGGYSSFPVLRFAQAKGLPTFIHEANSYAGKSNKLLGRKATAIFVASDNMGQFFPQEKIIITGNPVRRQLLNQTIHREQALTFFGLDPGKQTVLVIGGSLGAKSINETIDAGISVFQKNDLQLIWQTGKNYVVKAAERAVEDKRIWVNDFITRMELAFAAGDLVISRAGAMTIAELCVVRKPVIFVPYPFAAEDHQTVNAQQLASKNAGIMIKDAEVKELLIPELLNLIGDKERQRQLSENIGMLAVTNADELIADEILRRIN
jgi:UDP-N-acetylglucosamine--N-acetylmuramyl-(pentapeptide) pyrophosphoryl-undecaprenol N-acetylglucosamine transferase